MTKAADNIDQYELTEALTLVSTAMDILGPVAESPVATSSPKVLQAVTEAQYSTGALYQALGELIK